MGLVLSRKVNVRIVIPAAGITIMVSEVSAGGKVKIWIDAPPSLRVWRAEVLDRLAKAAPLAHLVRPAAEKSLELSS